MKKDGILRERRKNKLIDGYDDLVIYSITNKEVLFKKWLLFLLFLRFVKEKILCYITFWTENTYPSNSFC